MPARKLPGDVASLGVILQCAQPHVVAIRPLYEQMILAKAGLASAFELGNGEASAFAELSQAVESLASVETPLAWVHSAFHAERFLCLPWRDTSGRDNTQLRLSFLAAGSDLQGLVLSKCRELQERISAWEDLLVRVTYALDELAESASRPELESPEQIRDRLCYEGRQKRLPDKSIRRSIEAQGGAAPLSASKNAVGRACDHHAKRFNLPPIPRRPRSKLPK